MASKVNSAIQAGMIALVVLVVIFETYAVVVPEAQSASSAMNDSQRCTDAGGYYCTTGGNCTNNATNACGFATLVSYQSIPLNGLVNGTGAVYVIVMAGLLVVVFRSFLKKGK